MSLLDGLREHSLVVADTGDLDAIKRYQPQDATTNPSLILKAFELPRYQELIDKVLAESCSDESDLSRIVDQLSVAIGGQIANVVPGRISRPYHRHHPTLTGTLRKWPRKWCKGTSTYDQLVRWQLSAPRRLARILMGQT